MRVKGSGTDLRTDRHAMASPGSSSTSCCRCASGPRWRRGDGRVPRALHGGPGRTAAVDRDAPARLPAGAPRRPHARRRDLRAHQPSRGSAHVAEALGGDVALVPYLRPGLRALAASRGATRSPRGRARAPRPRDLGGRARAFLRRHGGARPPRPRVSGRAGPSSRARLPQTTSPARTRRGSWPRCASGSRPAGAARCCTSTARSGRSATVPTSRSWRPAAARPITSCASACARSSLAARPTLTLRWTPSSATTAPTSNATARACRRGSRCWSRCRAWSWFRVSACHRGREPLDGPGNRGDRLPQPSRHGARSRRLRTHRVALRGRRLRLRLLADGAVQADAGPSPARACGTRRDRITRAACAHRRGSHRPRGRARPPRGRSRAPERRRRCTAWCPTEARWRSSGRAAQAVVVDGGDPAADRGSGGLRAGRARAAARRRALALAKPVLSGERRARRAGLP